MGQTGSWGIYALRYAPKYIGHQRQDGLLRYTVLGGKAFQQGACRTGSKCTAGHARRVSPVRSKIRLARKALVEKTAGIRYNTFCIYLYRFGMKIIL